MRTEGIQGSRRRYFASGHTVASRADKGTATPQAAQVHVQDSCAGVVQWLASTREGKELICITLILLSVAKVCFLTQLIAAYAVLFFSYIRLRTVVDTTFSHVSQKQQVPNSF